jgi:hypothetical protein
MKLGSKTLATVMALGLFVSTSLAFAGQVTKTQPEGGEDYPNTSTAQNPATMAGQKPLLTKSQKAKKKAHQQKHQQKLQQEGQTPMTTPGQ